MKVLMKKTALGSIDGISIEVFDKDKIYDINESLANVFIKEGFCEKVENEINEKMISEKVENKMINNIPFNKGTKKRNVK
jgi:hypothetical protein